MKIKFKKLSKEAVSPKYAYTHDAGCDLTAINKSYDTYGNVVYSTGLAVEIPEGYVGLLFPRSSVSKQDLLMSNSVGVIDSGYQGEIIVKFKRINAISAGIVNYLNENELMPNKAREEREFEVGDRVAQLIVIPYPKVEWEEVDEFNSKTDRGEGGFGSSGS